MIEHVKKMSKNLDDARRGSVVVGLPKEKIGSTVYKTGATVLQVGAAHEYGAGVPRRSFLRTPFKVKESDIDKAITKQFRLVLEKGRTAKKALGLVGTEAVNIVKEAFTTRGYGVWPDISQATKDAKGSTQVLIDKGILRNSITYIVRGIG